MDTARKEYADILAKQRVQTALRKRPPPAAKQFYQVGQAVYVYREAEKRWTGPYLIVRVAEKQLWVDLGAKTGTLPFNRSQLKPARMPSIASMTQNLRVLYT